MLEQPLLYYWMIPLIIWSITWKAISLWKAARNRQLGWFLVLFIINSAGLLPILYIYYYQTDKSPKINF
jgi:methionyl-tRNA synthetase